MEKKALGLFVLLVIFVIVLAVLHGPSVVGGPVWGGSDDADAESFPPPINRAAEVHAVPIDYGKFLVSLPESRYSTVMPWQYHTFLQAFRDQLREFERRWGRPPRTLLDASAHVGVETVVLATNFELKGKAVELNPLYYRLLRTNLATFKVSVKAVKGDGVAAINAISKDPPDVLYLDPPWGGPGYKSLEKVPLELGGTPAHVLATRALRAGVRLFAVKTPLNYDTEPLERSARAAGAVVTSRTVLALPSCDPERICAPDADVRFGIPRNTFRLYFCAKK